MSDLREPEFVDVCGVPFQLLPMAKATGGQPAKRPEYQNVRTVVDRHQKRFQCPRLVQVDPDIQDKLDVDLEAIEPIRLTPRLDPTATYVELDLGVPHAGMGGETQDRRR